MFKLFKGGHCYNPDDVGVKDILVAYDRICKVENEISAEKLWDVQTYDCRNRIICPGFIDQHVHITGGGGEGGPASRIPELMPGEAISAGVTTLVGVLGVDDLTRNVPGVLAKAKALDIEGLSTFIYTGSYRVPTATITGSPATDLAYIDKVIGVGEIAVSDYRSSHPSVDVLKALASDTMAGALVGGKAGIMHIHVGDGKGGILPLFRLLEESDLPVAMFVPTHLNRNKALLFQAVEYGRAGGHIDLTAGEWSENGICVPDALELIFNNNIPVQNVTVSSDANGSIPAANGIGASVGKIKQLFYDVRRSIMNKSLPAEIAFRIVTSNVAQVLKLFPRKGALWPGSDADLLVLHDDSLEIDKVVAKGQILADNGVVYNRGFFDGRQDFENA